MPARVTITFGEPVYPTSEESVTGELSATDETIVKWGRQVAKLAGCPEFAVRLSQQRKSTRAGSI